MVQNQGIIDSDAKPVLFIQESKRDRDCAGNEEGNRPEIRKDGYLPAKKNPHLLLRFYDNYIYYISTKNLLALCSGSPAPSIAS